jgi:release factor glutamine methyltransferase
VRAVVQGACARLRRGGALAIEHGHDQAAAVRELFAKAGLADVGSLRDLARIERVTTGVLAT